MLRRLHVQTSGESHGKGMLACLTGIPAGYRPDLAAMNQFLRRRQGGFGRSARQRIEQDEVDVLSGLYRGRTTGAPLTLAVWNRDQTLDERPPVRAPRPGHGDLAGGQKYGMADMRPVLERASARETAARVAAGALAAGLLGQLGVELLAHVVALGGVEAKALRRRASLEVLRRRRDGSPFYVLRRDVEAAWKKIVRAAGRRGDSLGGVFEVLVLGLPAGLGSLDGFGSRLDARLGGAMLSIPGIKAVEIGDGVAGAAAPGSAFHDPVSRPGPEGPRRASNRAGGVEAGMSNGETVVVRAFMKPIPTLRQPLASWDYELGRRARAFVERSDVTSVPAASVVGEAMAALVCLDALLEKTGGDTLAEARRALGGMRRDVARRFGDGQRARKRGR